jgi:hypothetical protein
MRRFTSLASTLGLAFVLLACHGSVRAKDPYATLLAHTDHMIELLKENRGDPEKASKELTAYREQNGAEIERLKQELGEFMQRDPMKAAAVSASYGLKSAELATLTEELAAKTKGR